MAAEMVQRYTEQREPLTVLARAYGVHPVTVRQHLLAKGVHMRRRGGDTREFLDAESDRIKSMWEDNYSSAAIATALRSSQSTIHREMRRLGLEPKVRRKRGPAHGMWGGGKVITSQGYVLVRAEPDDPIASAMANSTGYVSEHRLAMARSLGRALEQNETVHHADGNKSNNAIANLQLLRTNHGKGARFRCNVCGSHDVVAVEIGEAAGSAVS